MFTNRKFHFVGFVVLQCLDALTTFVCLWMFPLAYEMNPVTAKIFVTFGLIQGLVTIKFFPIVAGYLFYKQKISDKVICGVFAFLNVIYTLILINNVINIIAMIGYK